MRFHSILELIHKTPLVRLGGLSQETGREIYAKLEGWNPGGSMKDRVALHCVNEAEKRGTLRPGGHIVESTSGNFGVGMSIVARQRGYRVTCVVDPKITLANLTQLRILGAKISMVDNADRHGNYLAARLARVQEILRQDCTAWWINQYSNADAPATHYFYTAAEISTDVPERIDLLACPVGTGGLITGVSRYFKDHRPETRILAVDAKGSVVLHGVPGPRRQVGIGSHRASDFIDFSKIDHTVLVDDNSAFQGARTIARSESILAGCSSGSCVAGFLQRIELTKPGDTVVLIFPDHGLKYVDTIFDDEWLRKPSMHTECRGEVQNVGEGDRV